MKPLKYYGKLSMMHCLKFAHNSDVRDRLIEKAAKEYPRADGLIFHFVTGKKDNVEAIKFKD